MSETSPKLQEAWYLRIISPHSRTHVMGAGMSLTRGKPRGWEGGLTGYLLLSFPRNNHSHRKGLGGERRGCLAQPLPQQKRGLAGQGHRQTPASLSHTQGCVHLCETWANRWRQASRRCRLPPLFPSQEFPPKVKMCFSLLPACQEPGLGSGMPAPTPLPRPDQARA